MKRTSINKNSSDFINQTSRDYSIYVCENRSIPSVSDGLKPAQRKALYVAMNKSEKIKTVSLSGMTISSNLYVHGDTSMNDTISKMAGLYINNVPFFKGTGCFGTKVSPNDSAAPRYTYVQKYNLTDELIYKDKSIIPYVDNYDGSAQEPLHFIPIIPLVLLNGISGIAVGWSCEILPYNIKDIIKATKSALNGKKINKLTPDYMHTEHDTKDLKDGKWEFYGKFNRTDTSTININSLPPEMSLEKINEILIDLEEKGKIKDFTDNSSKTINIDVKFGRGELKNYSDSDIIKLLKLYTKKTERLVTLDFNHDGIKQFKDVNELLTEFVNFRFQYYIKRYEKLLEDAEYEIKYWLSLLECFNASIGDFIKDMDSKSMMVEFIEQLTLNIKPSNEQIDKIASLPAYQFTKEHKQKCLDKIQEIKESIIKYSEMLNDHSLIKDQYNSELDELLKVKFDIKR